MHYTLGLDYEVKNRWDWAASEYEQALALNPDFTVARQRLGAAHRHRTKGCR